MEPGRVRRLAAATLAVLCVAAVALVAASTANLPSGHDTLTVTSGDGAKVWMDGEVVLDGGAPHESRVDRAHISEGTRPFKVQYYDIGGFAELRFDIQRR